MTYDRINEWMIVEIGETLKIKNSPDENDIVTLKCVESEEGDSACKRCYFDEICDECDFNASQLVCDAGQRPDKKFVIFELVEQ